ncbi:hypothetical protein BGZ46_007883 [Entomortierella lignicola]|nr:hypothetical protein BGZ46_007883 [Entomortierella lignicola]
MNPLYIPELINIVCLHLDKYSLLSGALVSRSWYNTCKPLLWESCSFSAEQYNAFHDVFDEHAPLIHYLEAKHRLIGGEMRFVSQHCVNLKALTLRFCQMSPSSLDLLCNGIPRVQYLTFDLCPGVNTTSLASRLARLPSLTHLEINAHKQDRGSGDWRENDMAFMLTQCLLLKQLKIVGADLSHVHLFEVQRHPTALRLEDIQLVSTFITENALKNLLGKSPNLFRLILLHNANKNSTVQAIAENCPNLRSLELKNSKSIATSAFDSVFKGCPLLTNLDISHTLIYDSVILTLAHNCHSLRVLDLKGCSRITHIAFLELMSTLKHLQYLCVEECTKLKIEAFSGATPWSCRESLEVLEMPNVGIDGMSDNLDGLVRHLGSLLRLRTLHLDDLVSNHSTMVRFLEDCPDLSLSVIQSAVRPRLAVMRAVVAERKIFIT